MLAGLDGGKIPMEESGIKVRVRRRVRMIRVVCQRVEGRKVMLVSVFLYHDNVLLYNTDSFLCYNNLLRHSLPTV